MPRRKLIKGDRVRITGPWAISSPDSGVEYIGKGATVVSVRETDYPDAMSIYIKIDGRERPLNWSRENLRALPRKKS